MLRCCEEKRTLIIIIFFYRALAAAKLLIRYGADVRAVASERHDNRTPLHYAVLSGNMETVKMLLDKGFFLFSFV